jgi:lipopolysaccharide transport system ATP-binding protein
VGARPSVEVRGLVKRYPMFARRRDRALALLGRTAGLTHLTALDGIDLEVRPGEAVGIIGENGSGKSTLLRLIAGISVPDEGEIRVSPPVAPILELGLGFHSEFTGRENAVLYGTLLGLPEEVVAERLDEVLAFAELGEFVDQPLRTYSSGMTARLAFAVATHVEPKVLVVDEALAVGDGAFQKKCIDRMVHFKEEGRAVLFCSHAMYLVTSFCQRAVWLHQGRVRRSGPAHEVVQAYEAYLVTRGKRQVSSEVGTAAGPTGAGAPVGHGWLEAVRVLGPAEGPTGSLPSGAPLEIELTVGSRAADTPYHLGVAIDTADGRCMLSASTFWDGLEPVAGRERHRVILGVPALPAGVGNYRVSGFLFDETGLHIYDQVVVATPLRVTSERWTGSLLVVPHQWKVVE